MPSRKAGTGSANRSSRALGQRVARSRIGHYESRGLQRLARSRPAGGHAANAHDVHHHKAATSQPRAVCTSRTTHCRGQYAIDAPSNGNRSVERSTSGRQHVHRRHHRPGFRVPRWKARRRVRAEMVLQAMTVEGGCPCPPRGAQHQRPARVEHRAAPAAAAQRAVAVDGVGDIAFQRECDLPRVATSWCVIMPSSSKRSGETKPMADAGGRWRG